MKSIWMLVAMLCLPMEINGQTVLPPGTIVPVSLDKSLDARKSHAGQEIRATVMQDVPGTAIRRRARVVGHVVQVSTAKDGSVSLELRFDFVKMNGTMAPLRASLRALASFMEVEEAQLPEDSSDRGLTPETWTTQQIGGEQVYRGGGSVMVGMAAVGEPTPWGILATPRTQPGRPCRGVVGENRQPQAMWLFSSDACGVYGFDNVRIKQAGGMATEGTIILTSTTGKLILYSGSGLLLRVS